MACFLKAIPVSHILHFGAVPYSFHSSSSALNTANVESRQNFITHRLFFQVSHLGYYAKEEVGERK